MSRLGRQRDQFIYMGPEDKPAADFLNELFRRAALEGMTDIQLRFVHGAMRPVEVADSGVRLISWLEPEYEGDLVKHVEEKLRARASMDLSEQFIPMDGAIHLRYPEDGLKLSLRASFLHTIVGSTAVFRLAREQAQRLAYRDIYMPLAVRRVIDQALAVRAGTVVVSGPMGSGKTTQLMAYMVELRDRGENVKTAEEPVEIPTPGIDQCELVPGKVTYPMLARAFLRQRAHRIMIGETRDEETAEALGRNANTGCQLWTTTHSDTSALVIERLLELKMPRDAIAKTLRLIIAPRLVRTIPAEATVEWVAPNESSKAWLKAVGAYHPDDKFPVIVSDHDMSETKMPIFEVIQIDDRVRRVILAGGDAKELYEAASYQPQFETLAEAGVRLAREGKTTLSAIQSLLNPALWPAFERQRLDKRLIASGVITPAQAYQAVETMARVAIEEHRVLELWEALISTGAATRLQVIECLGRTKEAVDLLGYFIDNGILEEQPAQHVIEEWKRGERRQSLFAMCIDQGLLSNEQIQDEAFLHYRRAGISHN